MTVLCKACVWGNSLAGIVVLIPAGGTDVYFLRMLCVCCLAEACASGWSLVQGNLTECGVSECDNDETLTNWGCCHVEQNFVITIDHILTYSVQQNPSWEANGSSPSQKKFPPFYGTRRFIAKFTTAHPLFLSWSRSLQSVSSHPTSLRSILILLFSKHLCPTPCLFA